ncbi:molecular chaperone GrpE [Prevotella sp. kh1p2]|nr:molecular chaperone GrpE [Prevotella sp. kh1p2]SNU10948.1 molecular chaperone GrpE [Prevotellaceae bacterium KH2P17]
MKICGCFFGKVFADYNIKLIIMSNKENKEQNINVEEGATEKEVNTKQTEQAASADNEQAETQPETADNTTAETAKEAEEAPAADPLAEANKQLEELKDKYLRTVAEFENYKKRTLKEKAELILNGGEKTITAILPVLDDMERAMANADKADSMEKLEEGWELIFKKFQTTLEGLGVKKIETEDADFNVDYHEAIAMVPGMGDNKKGKVIDCVQTGYTMNDKVIRHAKVAVGQ